MTEKLDQLKEMRLALLEQRLDEIRKISDRIDDLRFGDDLEVSYKYEDGLKAVSMNLDQVKTALWKAVRDEREIISDNTL